MDRRRHADRRLAGAGPVAGAALLALALLGAAVPAGAAIQVEAHLDRDQAAVGERVTLTVTVNGDGDAARPELPPLPDFAIYPAGTSRNFSFVNGRMASATVYTYILAPKHEGSFEIPPIGVTAGGTRATSSSLRITVVAESQAPPPGTTPAPPPGASDPRGRRPRGRDPRAVFVTADADPAHPYVGEQVTLTVRFYQGVRLLQRPDYKPPAATGFWVENLPGERTYYTEVEGRRYHVTELRTALFPTAAGELVIGPATVDCMIETDPFGVDPFSLFRGGLGMGEPRAVESRPITIQVRAIPQAGRPPDFSGAVGRFTIAARLEPETVRVGEAATLTVTLTGQGNVRALADPILPTIPGMRSFDSGSEVTDQNTGGTVGGVKKLTRVFVPETSGSYVIPAVTYPVFRPDRGVFEVVATQPIPLAVVEAGAGGVPVPARTVVAPQGGADLRFIRLGDPGLVLHRKNPWANAVFWILQVLPLAALAGIFLYARHEERVATDQGYARLRRSGKDARRRLRHARGALERGDGRAFHAAVAQALIGYVADRANRPAPGLTMDAVRAVFAGRGIDPGLADRFAGCLERCDFGRFAPAAGTAERELLAEAEELLTSLARAGL